MVLIPLLRTALSFGFCNLLKNENIRNDAFRRVIPGVESDFGYRGRALYAALCDGPPEETDPPFEGGQCQFCYNVTVTRTINDPVFPQLDGTASITQGVWGELSYLGTEVTTPSSGLKRTEAVFSGYGSCSDARLPSPIRIPITSDTTSESATVTIDNIQVVPRDGQPDDCGNPPKERPPEDPEARQFPINITINYNDGSLFDFSGTVYFGFAYFNSAFEINFPINIGIDNNVSFKGNFNFSTGDISLNFGDRFDYPTPPPPEGDYDFDPDQPPPPPTNFPPPPSFPPPFPPNADPDDEKSDDFDPEKPQQEEKIRRMIGVLVDTSVTPPTSTELGQNVNPDVYVPDIGLVNFAYLIGGTRLYWGEDIRVKNVRQVIFTPEGRYAVAVDGTPRKGAEWTLTPIYAKVAESVGGL